MDTIWKLNCEGWYVLYMIIIFHENMRWVDVKSYKLVMHDKQPIPCAKLKFWPKKSNWKHEYKSWNFHVGSWRNIFRSKMTSLSWVLDENANAIKSWLVGLMDYSLNEKFSSLKKYALSWEIKVNWVETWVLELRRVFLL